MDNFPNHKDPDPCPYCQAPSCNLLFTTIDKSMRICNKCGKEWTTESPAHLRT